MELTYSAVPESIQIHSKVDHLKIWGGGSFIKPKILKDSMEL